MMKIKSFILLAGLFLAACQSDNKATVDAQISTAEQELAAEAQPSPDKMEKLISLYEKHIETYPERVNANVNFLMKGAEAARSLGKFDKALAMYDRILKEHSGHKKASHALFMKGYTFDNDLHNQDSAAFYLQKFLQRYPSDDFADDAEFLLKNMGKSNEEIIKEFEGTQETTQGTQGTEKEAGKGN